MRPLCEGVGPFHYNLILYIVETLIPLDRMIRNLIRLLIVVALLLYLVQLLLGWDLVLRGP